MKDGKNKERMEERKKERKKERRKKERNKQTNKEAFKKSNRLQISERKTEVSKVKGKGHPTTGRGGPRGFLKFGITRVVGRQPYAPAAFTPGEIPGTHIQRLSRPQGTWFRWVEPRK